MVNIFTEWNNKETRRNYSSLNLFFCFWTVWLKNKIISRKILRIVPLTNHLCTAILIKNFISKNMSHTINVIDPVIYMSGPNILHTSWARAPVQVALDADKGWICWRPTSDARPCRINCPLSTINNLTCQLTFVSATDSTVAIATSYCELHSAVHQLHWQAPKHWLVHCSAARATDMYGEFYRKHRLNSGLQMKRDSNWSNRVGSFVDLRENINRTGKAEEHSFDIMSEAPLNLSN